MSRFLLTVLPLLFVLPLSAQNDDQLGAWYMYFYNHSFGEDSQWGIQGDAQYRNFNLGGDLEQLLLRSGITYAPTDAGITFTLGYANITTGTQGDSDVNTGESRVYQEALFPQRIGGRFLLTHRLRYEQRWVEGQDLRTRYRYNLFLNVPLNDTELGRGTAYLALYNELFINGQRDIGGGRSVQFFDRNRTYLGVGYGLRDNLRTQLGWMRQTTGDRGKDQLQVSLHHSW
ncbi:hypothetical protein GGR28_001433 [Lewinella aquimaris]|uniref:DUF2490 domain-containing protein n=1 Tax=Neolewinella aquimaris TaxID=1835722 RepID=A0A840ECY8_9BACT|nr:DUF2490 domain-containing protein [Neolewinella aquimaris]MBB4078816.1 hypothetical protein [Neolewinella aquimaris]